MLCLASLVTISHFSLQRFIVFVPQLLLAVVVVIAAVVVAVGVFIRLSLLAALAVLPTLRPAVAGISLGCQLNWSVLSSSSTNVYANGNVNVNVNLNVNGRLNICK